MSRRKQAKPRSVKAVEEGDSSEFSGNWDSASIQPGIHFVTGYVFSQSDLRLITFWMSHSTESQFLISVPHGPQCSTPREHGGKREEKGGEREV
ncbi:hypothetical protein UPYG_G00263550 [Umbra pygmaea]|uniref:Uncharacterized protein n=1 Tax=Umbra pygmaea TaxID=75934 RepID=A0ABD0WAZ9_UMBPY